jgi:hypothetical protein
VTRRSSQRRDDGIRKTINAGAEAQRWLLTGATTHASVLMAKALVLACVVAAQRFYKMACADAAPAHTTAIASHRVSAMKMLF